MEDCHQAGRGEYFRRIPWFGGDVGNCDEEFRLCRWFQYPVRSHVPGQEGIGIHMTIASLGRVYSIKMIMQLGSLLGEDEEIEYSSRDDLLCGIILDLIPK